MVTRCVPKKHSIRKLEVGTTSDASNEMEVVYIKVSIDGRTLLEIDKFTFVLLMASIISKSKVREALVL
ncbi:phage major tail tube protein [Anaerobacillus sp. HL2]|nr:phage major tail tube protein [Anaerobacillus sp. HL2]